MQIEHNTEQNRFEVTIDGLTSTVDYLVDKNRDLEIVHTEVPSALEGRGVAAALTKSLFEYARENSLKVYPSCPYSKVYALRHPEYNDIVVL